VAAVLADIERGETMMRLRASHSSAATARPAGRSGGPRARRSVARPERHGVHWYTIEQARELPDPAVAELLEHTDILVDGPYDRERPDTQRRWIGSTNQRIHFLTDRLSRRRPVLATAEHA